MPGNDWTVRASSPRHRYGNLTPSAVFSCFLVVSVSMVLTEVVSTFRFLSASYSRSNNSNSCMQAAHLPCRKNSTGLFLPRDKLPARSRVLLSLPVPEKDPAGKGEEASRRTVIK